MKQAISLSMAALLVLVLVAPSVAAVVVITAAAPLEDQSEAAVRTALDQAVRAAVDGAIQAGLRPIQLVDAEISADRVVVQVLATAIQPDEGDDGSPGPSPGKHRALQFERRLAIPRR